MRRGERLTITNVSGRNSAETVCTVIPLKILVSVQTGRRYLAARRLDARRFASFRLDYIKKAAPLPGEEGDAACKTLAEPLLAGSWGAAIPGRSRRQRFSMILAVDEERSRIFFSACGGRDVAEPWNRSPRAVGAIPRRFPTRER